MKPQIPPFALPRLYPIADIETLERRGPPLAAFARAVVAGGAQILQLRDKRGAPQQVLQHAAVVADALQGSGCLPVMNDRADLALLAGWRAVHVGDADLPPDAARRVFGEKMDAPVVVGVSTHRKEQVQAAEAGSADYLAVGPVFATSSKADAEPVIGLEGVRRLCALTRKPVVAIGGITLENAAAVLDAGAASVAVISGLLVPGSDVEATVRDFLRRLR